MFQFYNVDNIYVDGRNLSFHDYYYHIELGTLEEYSERIQNNYKTAKDRNLILNDKLFGTERLCLGMTSKYDLFGMGPGDPLVAIYYIDSFEDISLINTLIIRTTLPEDIEDNILNEDYIGKEVILYIDYYDEMFTRLYGTLEDIIATLYEGYDNEYNTNTNREEVENMYCKIFEELTIGTFEDVLYKLEDTEYSVVHIKSRYDMLAINAYLALSSPVYSNTCQRFVEEKNIGKNVLIYDGQCYGTVDDYIEELKTRYNNGKGHKFALDSNILRCVWNLVTGTFNSCILTIKPESNNDIILINEIINSPFNDDLFTNNDVGNEVLTFVCDDIAYRIGTLDEIIKDIILYYNQINVGGD